MNSFSNGPFGKPVKADSLISAVKGVLSNKDKKTIKLPETITEEDILSAAMELRENAQTWEDMKKIINNYLMEHARKTGEKLTAANATAFEREVLRAHNHKSVLKSLVETVEAKQEQLNEGSYGMMRRGGVEAEFDLSNPFNRRRRSTPMDAPPTSPSFLPGFPGSPVGPAGPNPMNPAVQPGLIPGGPMVQPNPGQPFNPGPPSFKDKEEEMYGSEEEVLDPAGRPTNFPFGTPMVTPDDLPINVSPYDFDLDGDGIPDIIDPNPLNPNVPIHGGLPGSPVYNPPTTDPLLTPGLPPQPRPELPFTPAGRDPFGVPLDDPDAQPEGEMSRPPIDPEMMKKLMMMMKSKMGGM
jgi:hypothetical protein